MELWSISTWQPTVLRLAVEGRHGRAFLHARGISFVVVECNFFLHFDHLLSHGSLQGSFTYPWLGLLVFCFFCSSKWKNVPFEEEALAAQLSALQEYTLQTLILSFGSPWAPTAVRWLLCGHYYHSASGPSDFVCFRCHPDPGKSLH